MGFFKRVEKNIYPYVGDDLVKQHLDNKELFQFYFWAKNCGISANDQKYINLEQTMLKKIEEEFFKTDEQRRWQSGYYFLAIFWILMCRHPGEVQFSRNTIENIFIPEIFEKVGRKRPVFFEE